MHGMRLHRFPYSSYARFVQAALALGGIPVELVDVPFGDRDALVALTGGYLQVPVVETDDGEVLTDSRRIVATLVARDPRMAALVPAADAALIWAYVDWAGAIFEDVAFRLATPGLALRFARPFERALFVFVKERKYGAGCVDAWARDEDRLAAALHEALAPTAATLAARPFLVGDAPTLADAALYGQLVMLDFGAPVHIAALAPSIRAWKARLEARMGPPLYGRSAARWPTLAELAAAPLPIDAAARTGAVARIVLRPRADERVCPREVTAVVDVGLTGDRGGRPDAQVSLMDTRVAAQLGAEADWELFGDNLFVDLELSTAAIQPGDRLAIGDVVLIATDQPHLGCRKLMARFGADALRWVNDRAARGLRRRGLYTRVATAGVIRVGDRAIVSRA